MYDLLALLRTSRVPLRSRISKRDRGSSSLIGGLEACVMYSRVGRGAGKWIFKSRVGVFDRTLDAEGFSVNDGVLDPTDALGGEPVQRPLSGDVASLDAVIEVWALEVDLYLYHLSIRHGGTVRKFGTDRTGW